MSEIVQRLVTDYSGKDTGIDVLIERYKHLEADCTEWRQKIRDEGLTIHMDSGFVLAHPLIKHLLTMERMLHITIRELMFAIRLHNWDDDKGDEVDTFLAEIQRSNRPHQSRHRGD